MLRAAHRWLPGLAVLLAACAPAPVTRPAEAPIGGSGLVIGTLSYHYVDVETPEEPELVVHFERIDAPAAQDYALAVNVDPGMRRGVFTGALPAGVYAFRAAASAGRRYNAGVLSLPFEVQPGAVQDAGHYALNPLVTRQ